MQLTNIARDVGEDLGRNRVYLPREWLSVDLKNKFSLSTKINIAELSNSDRESFADATYRLLTLADCYYTVANVGIDMLPADCRNSIRTASKVYQEIGNEVRRNKYNSIDQRAYVAFWKKIWLFLQVVLISYIMFSMLGYVTLDDINDINPKTFAIIDKPAVQQTVRMVMFGARSVTPKIM
jgi:phytoene synthase